MVGGEARIKAAMGSRIVGSEGAATIAVAII